MPDRVVADNQMLAPVRRGNRAFGEEVEIMTLNQLRYAVMVAKKGTITDAANELYIAQPSLTKAVHELEKEVGITIFDRTNKGIKVSKEGEQFLAYARQVLEQADMLEEKSTLYVQPFHRLFCQAIHFLHQRSLHK